MVTTKCAEVNPVGVGYETCFFCEEQKKGVEKEPEFKFFISINF